MFGKALDLEAAGQVQAAALIMDRAEGKMAQLQRIAGDGIAFVVSRAWEKREDESEAAGRLLTREYVGRRTS